MSSEDLKFIKTLKECGYEGHLDPTVFKSVPKHLMKWLSENINSSVLLTPDQLTRLEDLETKNLLTSGSSEVNSSGFSCSRRWSSESSPSLSGGTDDSDILFNKDISEDLCGDDSDDDDDDDDDEIKYLRKEIRAEDERNVMLRQLSDSLMKKLEKVTGEVQAEEKMKEHVMQKVGTNTDQLCALYKDVGCAYMEMVQQAQQVSEVLGSRDCEEKKFLHQVIGETLEENFKKFLINVEKFVEKQKHEVVVPVGEGEKFLFNSAPVEVTENLDEQRVNILTKELCNLVPRIADLRQLQLDAECAAFAKPAAEKLLTDIQTGKYITLEQLNKTEELRKDIAKLEVEVEELSQAAACTVQQQAQAQVLSLLRSSAEELVRNFSAKQRVQEKFKVCMESYLCALILLRSVLACQSDTIGHVTSFIRDTHQYVTSKHSQALSRMDTMHKLQEEHRHDQMVQTVANNILLKTFQKLLLGEEEPCCATVDSVFDLMSTSLNQLKARKDQAYEEHYSTLVDSNITTMLENKKEVDSLCNYLLLDESITGFPSALLKFNDQFAMARTAIENFVKKKEQFKSSYDAEHSKIKESSQVRKELLEWVKFVTHGKHCRDETFAESSTSEQNTYEEARK